ncbi:MAG: ABC transporter ATP-binding protein [Thermotaleaceae bacterium]
MGQVIVAENLSKVYKNVRAVDNLNLSIKKGEIFGFLGLNGAGKTTTIKMFLDLVRPSQGACYLNGDKVDKNNPNIWNNVGYMVETPYAYPELTVKENLQIIKKLRGLDGKDRVAWIMKKLGLESYENVKAQNLSLGNAQRLGIAKALIHRPGILLLDEPTNGLDPAGIVEVRKLLLNLSENEGVTILISSHKLDEISKIATKIGIIHEGRLIKLTDLQKIKKELKGWLTLDGKNQAAIYNTLTKSGYGPIVKEAGVLKVYDKKAINAPEKIASLLVKSKLAPSLLKVEEEDLEEFFLRTIKEGGPRQ